MYKIIAFLIAAFFYYSTDGFLIKREVSDSNGLVPLKETLSNSFDIRNDTITPSKRIPALVITVIGAATSAALGAFFHKLANHKEKVVAVANRQTWQTCIQCDTMPEKCLLTDQALTLQFKENFIFGSAYKCAAKWNGQSHTFAVFGDGAPKWEKILWNLHNDALYYTAETDDRQGIWTQSWNK